MEQPRIRYMRLIVFFDLPVETSKDRKEYRKFRKYLIKDGFLMLQESVYSKLVLNDGMASAAITRLKNNRPPAGLVQVLKVTEKQFSTMATITGKQRDYEEMDSIEEFVVI